MIVQSLLPGSPDDVSAEGRNLAATVRVLFPSLPQPTTENGLNEPCPACQIDIPLTDITNALCPNGHAWGKMRPGIIRSISNFLLTPARCSVTTFILSTPHVRTCIGCTRKAFLPVSSLDSSKMLPQAARGWFVEELLEAVHRCLFCGNGFVSVL